MGLADACTSVTHTEISAETSGRLIFHLYAQLHSKSECTDPRLISPHIRFSMAEAMQHASWEAWGEIVPDHVRNRSGGQKKSRYARQQQDSNADIPCCVRFAVPRDGGPEYKVVYGIKGLAEIKIKIAGGTSSSFFRRW